MKSNNIIIDIKELVIASQSSNSIIVDSLSFSLEKKKITALIGASGSGKSLTAKSILGLARHLKGVEVSGEILLHTNNGSINILNLQDKQLEKIRGFDISMVFQDPYSSFDPIQSIGEQLLEVLRLSSTSNSKETAINLLSRFGISASKFNSYPHELSGGQLQRIGIAIAVANNPSVLIADEPTTNLDASVKKEFLDLLVEIKNEQNIAVLYISHDLEAVRYIADEIVFIHEGKLIEVAKKTDFFDSPKQNYTKDLLNLSFKNKEGSRIENEVKKSKLLLEVIGINKSFNNKSVFSILKGEKTQVLKNISFRLNENEILGVVGESGSGKTTLDRILLRLIDADSGKVVFLSNNILAFEAKQIKNLRKDVQVVFQNPSNSLNPALNIKQLLSEAIRLNGILKKAEIESEISNLLSVFGLDKSILDRNSNQISGGEAQRIAIMRAIISKPRLLILDESVSSLDRKIQVEVLMLLMELKDKYKLSYLFITHDIGVCYEFCDNIIVLKNGEIVDSGTVDYIFKGSNNEYTQKLINSFYLNT